MKNNFRYITLEELNNGLKVSLNEEGVELVKELKDEGKSDYEIWYELFEDVRANSEYIFHDDIGESGFGLTDSEGITDGYFYSDNGDGFETEYPESAKVYWFPNYMISSPLDIMIESGDVIFTKADEKYENGGNVSQRFIFGIEYKEKPSSRVFKKSSLTMVGKDTKEMNDAINENAELLKEQEGWHEVKITKKPIMDNGGSIDDDTIVRNKNKNDWKSKFDFYLKYNKSNIGKGTLMDMAYDNTKGIDSAIPQSLVGDVDNSAFYVFDYKDNFDGKLVDLRDKLKFSNTKVAVTIVVDGVVLYKDKLPDELLNPTFHQALDYVFNHDEVEAFDIRPRKDKYAKGGGVNRPFSFTNDKIFTKDNISVQRVGGSDMWEVSINGEPKGRVLGAQTSDYAIKKAEKEFKNKYANGGKVQGIKMNFKVYADGDYAREEEESKILLLRKYFDFDEVDGKIDYESSLYNTNLKFYNKGKEVMTLKGDYNNDKEELDAIIRIGDSESKLNYHPYDGMGGFSSFLLEEQIKNSAKELKTYTAVVSVEGYEKYSEEFDNIDSAKRSIKDIKSNTKFQVVKGEVGEGKLVKDDKVIDTFSNGGGIEKWKSVQSIKFKTKKEANKRLELHKSDNDIRNSRIEEVSKGDDLNHGYVIKYEIIDKENKYENGGGVEKELNGYRVNIYKSKNYNSPQNVVSNEFDKIILVTDGIKGDSSSVMSNEPYIKLVRRNLFGKEVLSAEPVNFGVDKNHKMFGGTFVWSSDSRFRNDISERPIALHDRVEVYENGGIFVSPHVKDLHNYIISAYGFLLPIEEEEGYNNFTYSNFAEELKSNYDIKNPRNKQVYDYLIHLGNVPMFSGNVADMKKIEERMSTANINFENGGGINDKYGDYGKDDKNSVSIIDLEIGKKYKTPHGGDIVTIKKIDKSGEYSNLPVAITSDNRIVASNYLLKIDNEKYSKGGVVGENSKIKDWYIKEYSSDDLGKELNDESTFKDLLIAILNGNDVYSVLGVGDSIIRERAFAKLSKINGKGEQWAYNNWLMYDKFGNGGNIGRDLLFKSNEPHEQAYKRKREFKKYGSNGSWFSDFFENGGDISNQNALMVMNDNKQIKHHSEELNKVVGKNTQVPAWVVSKVHRSASDLSDATHYLDGVNSEFEEGGKISYGSIKKEKERMTSELFEKCGVFFAFSNEQFAKNKTPLKEGEKYVSIGAGGYMPKGNVDAFRKGMKEISQFGKNKVKENKLDETEILYELNNHECFYTGDYSDVVDMFKGTYTEEQIRDVYNKNIDKYSNGGTVESLEKELRKLQRDLNSSRLSTYMEGDESEEQKALNKEREVKLARFNEVLGLLREKDSKFSKGGGINSGRDLLFKSNEPHEQNYNRKREFKKYGSNGNWFNDFFEEGGNLKYSVTAYLGEVISINTAEMALGRKINSWKDDVITIDGISYQKVFLKPEYKQIK